MASASPFLASLRLSSSVANTNTNNFNGKTSLRFPHDAKKTSFASFARVGKNNHAMMLSRGGNSAAMNRLRREARREHSQNRAIADDTVGFTSGNSSNSETSSAPSSTETQNRLVTEILENVDDGAFGGAMSPEKDQQTFENIKQLELVSQIKPLSNPKIFGYYDVAYTKAGSKQDGAPAGGVFRSKIGRLIFKTEGLEQNLVEPNFVENRVAFELFGCIPGEVKLRGTFEQSKAHDNDGKTVRAQFGSPTFRIFGFPAVPIGPKSEVTLATTYIDDRVRLGLGGRGSRFVFRRKSKEQHERDMGYWGVGGLAVVTNIVSTVCMFLSARYYQSLGTRPGMTASLYAACALLFFFNFILRHAGKKCERDGWEVAPELSEEAKSFLKGTRENKTENVFGRSNN